MEGDLSRVGLPGLVQMLCGERQSLALRLHRTGEEGVIYIDHGAVVHASLGYAQGEGAFYELASWTEGSFRVDPVNDVPPTTIRGTTQHLLMEAMRRHDEARRTLPVTHEKSLSKAAFVADQALEQHLLKALSQAERGVDSLRSDKVRKKPELVIGIMADMVNQFVELVETVKPAEARTPSLTAALEAAAVSHEAVGLVEIEGYRISVRATLDFYRSSAHDAAVRQRFFHDLIRGLASVVTHFCMRLAGFFSYPEMGEEWAEVYNVFALDLMQALESLKF